MINRRGFLQAIGLGPLAAIKLPKEDMMSRPNPLHESLQPDRLNRIPERIYAEEWEKYNKRKPWLNRGCTYLEWILCPSSQHGPLPVSERDAKVAASVIQWLGTNCGLGFTQLCEKRIKEETS